MSRTVRVILISTTLIICFVVGGGEAFAKGGRGGSRGGKRSFAGGGSKGVGNVQRNGRSVRGDSGSFKASNSVRAKPGALQGGPHVESARPAAASFGKTNGTDLGMVRSRTVNDGGALDHHRSRELNKLNHRRRISDQLRSLSGKNGNENLNRVADEMDRRAQDHYDRQMVKFDPSYISDDTMGDQTSQFTDRIDFNRLENTANLDAPIKSDEAGIRATPKLTGTENALSRQVRNEERKLSKRLESVNRMRQLAAQSGDHALLQTADRLEEWAMNDFDQRMMKITNFQERHGLPDVSNYLSQ